MAAAQTKPPATPPTGEDNKTVTTGTTPPTPPTGEDMKQGAVTKSLLKTVRVEGLFGGYGTATFGEDNVATVDEATHKDLMARFGDAVVEVPAKSE